MEMENAICLDSDFLIDFLRKKEYALTWVKDNEDRCTLATTIINAFELFTGAYSYDENAIKAVENLISKLRILDFSLKSAKESGKQYAELSKSGKMIKHRDLFIGIIALTEGFSMKTNNLKHFSRIKGLKIV